MVAISEAAKLQLVPPASTRGRGGQWCTALTTIQSLRTTVVVKGGPALVRARGRPFYNTRRSCGCPAQQPEGSQGGDVEVDESYKWQQRREARVQTDTKHVVVGPVPA